MQRRNFGGSSSGGRRRGSGSSNGALSSAPSSGGYNMDDEMELASSANILEGRRGGAGGGLPPRKDEKLKDVDSYFETLFDASGASGGDRNSPRSVRQSSNAPLAMNAGGETQQNPFLQDRKGTATPIHRHTSGYGNGGINPSGGGLQPRPSSNSYGSGPRSSTANGRESSFLGDVAAYARNDTGGRVREYRSSGSSLFGLISSISSASVSGVTRASTAVFGVFSRGSVGNRKKKDDASVDRSTRSPASNSALDSVLSSNDWMSNLSGAASAPSSQSSPPQVSRSHWPREGACMAALVILMFVGFNLTSIVSQEQGALQKLRQRRQNRLDSQVHHEEGMDRPNSYAYMKRIQQQRQGAQRVVGGVMQPGQFNRAQGKPPTVVAPPQHEVKKSPPPQQQQQQQQQNEPQVQIQPPVQVQEQAKEPPKPQEPPKQQEPPQVPTASVFDNIANLLDKRSPKDVPFFWHIPKAGGSTVKAILGSCMGFTLGCELGADPAHAGDKLEVFDAYNRKVINVDFYNPKAIEKGRELGVATSGLMDVVVSPYLHQTATIFNPEYKGRLFTMIRNPIDRAASNYWVYVLNHLKKDPLAAPLTVAGFAKSNKVENNWMTRFLCNKMAGPLVEADLQQAKDLLRTKFIVGLLELKKESIQRYFKYFGWKKGANAAAQEECMKDYVTAAKPSNTFTRSPVKEGTQEYNLLLMQNSFDMELYTYAKELFQQQQYLFN